MKSIFVLNKFGISMTILKKLFDLNITYLDLEFFGEEVLKKNNIRNQQLDDIMTAFHNSKEDNEKNIALELQFYSLGRTHINAIKEKNITLLDIENLSETEFCNKYSLKNKVYIEFINSYNMFLENNRNIQKCEDYAKYLLEFIKKHATLKSIDISLLKDYLNDTTYPMDYYDKDLNILHDNNLIVMNNNMIEYHLPSVLDEIKKLDEKKHDIIFQRLSGFTLQEIGDKYNLTRERIRQIIVNIYSKLPIVKEEKYKNVYEKYELTEEQFIELFDVPKSTYYYLFDKYKKGVGDLSDVENDFYFDDNIQKRLKKITNKILLDGIYVSGNRGSITKHCLKNRCNGDITIPEFYKMINNVIYNELSEYNIDGYETEHSLESSLIKRIWCVFGKNKKIRYYEMNLLSDKDIENLNKILDVEYGLYSSLYFYENNIDLMEELDIRNEQELHNILKNLIENEKIEYLRMPNILIGYDSKEEFFIDKFTEYSPILTLDFLKIMRKEYGHREDTLMSYLCLEYKSYITGDKIISELINLTNEDIKMLATFLNKYVYTINEFKNILKNLNFDKANQLMNNINLKKINYKIVSGYVIKDTFNSLEEALYSAIYKGDINHSFLSAHSTGYAYITKLEKEFKVIEINNKFYPFENLFNLGINMNDIDIFIELVKKEFKLEKCFFTTKIIRRRIECNLLKNININDSILNSLIKLVEGVKRISWHGNVIFCYSPIDSVARTEFLYNVIKNNNNIELKHLLYILEDEFGVIINEEQLKNLGYNINISMENNIFKLKENN